MTGNGESKVRRFLTGCLAAGALVGVYCFATIGISSLLMTATDISAQAKGGHGGHHGGHGGHHGGHGGHHGGHGGHHGGHGGHHGRHGGHHGRHFWHGHWWGYGEGPCWRWTPAGYVWTCD
jgi:hypothetical protein